MGFRLRKSINLGGARINLSKSGIGYSFGTKGMRVTKKANGKIMSTVGLPGTGVHYTKEVNMINKRHKKIKENAPTKKEIEQMALKQISQEPTDFYDLIPFSDIKERTLFIIGYYTGIYSKYEEEEIANLTLEELAVPFKIVDINNTAAKMEGKRAYTSNHLSKMVDKGWFIRESRGTYKINIDAIYPYVEQFKEYQEQKEKQLKSEPKGNKNNKFYTQTWFMWLMLIFFAPVGIFLMWKFNDKMKKDTKIILTIVFAIFFLIAGSGDETTTDSKNSIRENVSKVKVEVIDFNGMQEDEILNWCNEKKLNCSFKKEYSDTIAKDNYIEQSVKTTEQVVEGSKITITYSLGKEPTTEQKNALKKAENYAKLMNMSKARIYKQLTSQYGEAFDEDAAQYAIDNIKCDWNANALKKAKSYRDNMSMSKDRIYRQLTSEYGEQFTAEEAQYAIDHLDD